MKMDNVKASTGTGSESRCLPSDNCCTPGVDCPACNAVPFKRQRVRKEVRSLSVEAYAKVTAAIKTLKLRTKGTTYDTFVAKQMAAYYDSRGDQTSTGTSFFNWHSLFLLEFELELLKIDPSIGALPYWDWSVPNPSPFTKFIFGMKPGQDKFYQVVEGPFQYFKVGSTDSETWTEKIVPNYTTNFAVLPPGTPVSFINFTGETETGLLRSAVNQNINAYITRQEPYSFDMGGERCLSYNDTDPLALGLTYDCASEDNFPFTVWQQCMEGNNVFNEPPWDNISMISTPMQFVGGTLNCTDANLADLFAGDLKDAASSSNDPVFWFHHANLERRKMQWMLNNTDAASYFYGYPKYGANLTDEGYHAHTEGIYGLGLNESISYHFGFKDSNLGIFVHPDNPNHLWTHGDALCYLQPHTAPYTYDSLIPPKQPIDPGVPIVSASGAASIMNAFVAIIIVTIVTLEGYPYMHASHKKEANYAPANTQEH